MRGDGAHFVPAKGVRRVDLQLPSTSASFGVGNAVTVPADRKVRLLFGRLELTPAVALHAQITVFVETGIGTGVYAGDVIGRAHEAGGLTVFPFFLPVPGGRRFYFDRTAGAGVTETATFDYVDVW